MLDVESRCLEKPRNHSETHVQHQTQWQLHNPVQNMQGKTILKHAHPHEGRPWLIRLLSLANTIEAKRQISHGISEVYIEAGTGRGKIHKQMVEHQLSPHPTPPATDNSLLKPIETTMSFPGDAVMSSLCTFCLAVACCRHQYRAKHALLAVLSPWDSTLSSGTYMAWVIKTKSGLGKHIIHQNNVGEIINEG